jgi:hypothetical protein
MESIVVDVSKRAEHTVHRNDRIAEARAVRRTAARLCAYQQCARPMRIVAALTMPWLFAACGDATDTEASLDQLESDAASMLERLGELTPPKMNAVAAGWAQTVPH